MTEGHDQSYKLCLAGLLHDVGKIGQRACKHKYLSDDSPIPFRDLGTFLPTNRYGNPNHLHVAYTWELLEKWKLLGKVSDEKTRNLWGDVEGLALNHHKASTPLQQILSRADHLAAAVDRQDDPDESDDYIKQMSERPLISVLSLLRLNCQSSDEACKKEISEIAKELGKQYKALPIRAGLEVDNFLELTVEGGYPHRAGCYKCNADEYRRLWHDGLLKCHNPIDLSADRDAVLEKAAALIDWYGWTVPSATNAFPDISLADHSKATAILAAAMGAYLEALPESQKVGDFEGLFGRSAELGAKEAGKPTGKLEAENADEALFRLVVGDLAGIQAFISDTKSDGASRNLKARSFLVDMWADRIAALVLREFGMPEVCKVYATGGKFLLIVPNIEKAHETLDKTLSEVNKGFESDFDGQVSIRLRLADVPLCQADLYSKGFGMKLHHLLEKELPRRSQKQDVEKDEKDAPNAFRGLEPREWEIDTANRKETTFEKNIKALGQSLSRMKALQVFTKHHGDKGAIKVPGANEWIVVSKFLPGKNENPKSKLTFSFNELDDHCDGLRWYAGANSPSWEGKPVKEAWGKSQEDIKELLDKDPVNLHNFWLKLYAEVSDSEKADKDYPKEPGGLISFSSLDDAAKIATGFGRVGILRMDVDNLGWLMAKGLDVFAESRLIENMVVIPKNASPDEQDKLVKQARDRVYSLGRMMSLSSLLVKFFSGILPKILDEWEVRGNDGIVLTDGYDKIVHASDLVFIIYSGGDDAFLVGPWFLMPELAMRIRECFGSWTGGNYDVGVSAGIALVGGKYPISVGAKDAGDSESAAKNLLRATKAEKKAVNDVLYGKPKKEVKSGAEETHDRSGKPVRKDRLDFLEFTAGWQEWREIERLREELEQTISKPDDRGFIRLLGKVAIAFRDGLGKEDGKAGWLALKNGNGKAKYSMESLRSSCFPGRWRPLLHYGVEKITADKKRDRAREFANILKCGEVENVKWRKDFAKSLVCEGKPSEKREPREPIEYLATVVRWAEYRGRNRSAKTSKKEEN